jgi:hypothetical protein
MLSDRSSIDALKNIISWYACYNFWRIHRTIRVTPAMEAGITDHVWDLAELLP